MKKMVICTGMLLCMGGQAMAAASGYTRPSQVNKIIKGTTYRYNNYYGTLYVSTQQRKATKEERNRERTKRYRNKKGLIGFIRRIWAGKSAQKQNRRWVPNGPIYFSVGYNYKGIPLFRIGHQHYLLKRRPTRTGNNKVWLKRIEPKDVNKEYALYNFRGQKIKVSLGVAARPHSGPGVVSLMPKPNPNNPTYATFNLGIFGRPVMFAIKSGKGLPGKNVSTFINTSWHHVEGHMSQILYLLVKSGKYTQDSFNLYINYPTGPCSWCRNSGDNAGKGWVAKILPKNMTLKVLSRKTPFSNWAAYNIEGTRL